MASEGMLVCPATGQVVKIYRDPDPAVGDHFKELRKSLFKMIKSESFRDSRLARSSPMMFGKKLDLALRSSLDHDVNEPASRRIKKEPTGTHVKDPVSRRFKEEPRATDVKDPAPRRIMEEATGTDVNEPPSKRIKVEQAGTEFIHVAASKDKVQHLERTEGLPVWWIRSAHGEPEAEEPWVLETLRNNPPAKYVLESRRFFELAITKPKAHAKEVQCALQKLTIRIDHIKRQKNESVVVARRVAERMCQKKKDQKYLLSLINKK